MDQFRHISVMPKEVLKYLAPVKNGLYVDGTVGGGGHSRLILEAISPEGNLIGFDQDSFAINAANENLKEFGNRYRLINRNFADMVEALDEIGIKEIDGFVLDLGVSSYQLDTDERGFSFQKDAPLDMRMDTAKDVKAADLVNSLSHGELARIIREYGEERWAGRIASFICKAREDKEIETTTELAEIVKGAIPRGAWEERIHPATRTFQALRIAVNDELKSLETGLESAIELLKPKGRGVVISFHSLEDRIVKGIFRGKGAGCICPPEVYICNCGHSAEVTILTKRPVVATSDEVLINPRSRSAKLRAVQKR
ncbi:MAG: 16S rRNA (cytosine(1402)-N(4))-methyltransferase RsmH [Desulfuromonadales bacterium]|nr:16S rRNA (cytosine(1402)-N(4))-methyltransferase RsmH [Desulfuromonadales bacterium]